MTVEIALRTVRGAAVVTLVGALDAAGLAERQDQLVGAAPPTVPILVDLAAAGPVDPVGAQYLVSLLSAPPAGPHRVGLVAPAWRTRDLLASWRIHHAVGVFSRLSDALESMTH